MDVYDGDKVLGFVREGIRKLLDDNPADFDPQQMTFGDVVDALQSEKTGRELSRVSARSPG